MFLPKAIISVLAYFQPAFSAPTESKALALLVGTLLARGRRTVATALRYLGLAHRSNFNKYHQVLSRAKWSGLKVSKLLLQALVATFGDAIPMAHYSWLLTRPSNGAGAAK